MLIGTVGSIVSRLFTGTSNLLFALARPPIFSLDASSGTAPVSVTPSVLNTAMIGAGVPSGRVL